MKLIDFAGTTYKVIDKIFDSNSPAPYSSCFFKPFDSASSSIGRMTSIVSDAPLLLGISAFGIIISAWELWKAIGNLRIGELVEAENQFRKAGCDIVSSLLVLGLALVSPLVNTVDLMGSILISIVKYIGTEKSLDNIVNANESSSITYNS